MMNDSIILKTEEELLKDEKEFRGFFKNASLQEFWKAHFLKYNFDPEPDNFNWEYWRKIPLMTKEEFSDNLRLKLRDAEDEMSFSIFNFLLRVTSGTTAKKPALLLHYISEAEKTIEDLERGIRLWQPYHIGLRWALPGILLNKKNAGKSQQFLIIDPFKIDSKMANALIDFKAQSINGLPSNLSKFAAIFSSFSGFASSIKKIIFGGDFVSRAQFEIIRNFFPKINDDLIVSDYIMTECGRIGTFCEYLKKKYGGYQAYHPAVKNGVMEIVNADSNGYGEIIVSKIKPDKAAIIRYRTGDVGKALREKCPCGNTFSLLLLGRADFDYIKCAGTLIIRKELERVLNNFHDDIKEWRADVRELSGVEPIGELSIKIKPSEKLSRNKNKIQDISLKISGGLFLTPSKTLSDLVADKKFMPLRMEIVDEFPDTQKKILLRKIED